MMLFAFIKKGETVMRVGADCDVPEKLGEVFAPYSQDGWELATAEEHDAQVIGVLNKRIAELEAEKTISAEVAT